MKSVMLSIRPKWCEKIASGEKTIEVRKTKPKLETPFKCYIYCTSGRPDLNIPISPERLMQDYLDTGSMQSLNCPLGNGKVIGEFTCDRAEIPRKLRENYIYKVGVVYGNVIENEKPIEFYFEKQKSATHLGKGCENG